MQLAKLKPAFDRLQKRYGSPRLNAIYGAGQTKRPDICFIFINPTGRNVSAQPSWPGLRAPWIGTKNIWRLFARLNLISAAVYRRIYTMKPEEWTPAFARRVYNELKTSGVYVTNLSKATQDDAHTLSNAAMKAYLPLLMKELSIIKPHKIIALGNQVSSILLHQPIAVSCCRGQSFPLRVAGQIVPVYPIHYPVGQGMMNFDKAQADIRKIK